MYTNPPKLTPRLSQIAALVPQDSAVADIGTDHAYLPILLSMTCRCRYIIASDIKKGPVRRAEEMVDRYGQMNKISVRLGAGLDSVSPGEIDCIVIAGMGGLVITDILKKGMVVAKKASTIILQPMTAVQELREFLINNGFSITEEFLAKEDNKIYNIIKAGIGESSEKYEEFDYYIGKLLIENMPAYTNEYLEKEKKKLEKMLIGLEASSSAESELKKDLVRKYLSKINNILGGNHHAKSL